MGSNKPTIEKLAEAFAELGINLPTLSFVERNSLSVHHSSSVVVHEVDRTPVVFAPEFGSGRPKENCFGARDLDVGGRAATGRDGKLTWRLSDFICEQPGGDYTDPVSFVATAQADAAVTITIGAPVVGNDVTLDVFSWDSSGAPAPNVRFSWRFWAPINFVAD